MGIKESGKALKKKEIVELYQIAIKNERNRMPELNSDSQIRTKKEADEPGTEEVVKNLKETRREENELLNVL